MKVDRTFYSFDFCIHFNSFVDSFINFFKSNTVEETNTNRVYSYTIDKKSSRNLFSDYFFCFQKALESLNLFKRLFKFDLDLDFDLELKTPL